MNFLLLRGLAREQRHWGDFVEVLASQTGARVHTLDLPGMGTENRRPSPANVDAIVLDVRRRWLTVRAQHEGAWRLLGVSLGGMVAMAWAARFVDDFERLILVNTSAGNLSPPWRRMRPSVLPRLSRALLETGGVTRELAILRATTTRLSPERARAIAERWAELAHERPIGRRAILGQLLAASRFRAPSRVATPTLVLGAAGDPLTHPDCARAVADHFGARLAVHPDGGHDLMLDDAAWVAARVKEID